MAASKGERSAQETISNWREKLNSPVDEMIASGSLFDLFSKAKAVLPVDDDVRIVLEKDGSAAVELKPGWHIFDYASLPRTARADTTWVLHLVKTGWYKSSTVFREGVPIDIPPDAQPRWTFICYDERFTVRVAHRCRSDSIEDELLIALRRAIAFPYPPCTASLPSKLGLSPNLRAHLGQSQPFLATLSPKLSWHVQTSAEFESSCAAASQRNYARAAASRGVAEGSKGDGNAAYARGDRIMALQLYSLALLSTTQAQAHMLGAWEPATQRLRAVVLANLAAASLMPGPVVNVVLPGMGMDLMRGLEGGMLAEAEDPTYAKGYIRQAAALEKLGNKPEAVRAIRRALARPELKNDRGLLARLAELLADGRSLSTE